MRMWHALSLAFVALTASTECSPGSAEGCPAADLLGPSRAIYDYIVVGSGPAGATVARRLAENPSVSVLLLEAGPQDSEAYIHIPLACAGLQKSSLDWQFVTEPQKEACRAFNDKRARWPRGRVLGGSTSINFMMYDRANPGDYDAWRDEYGCPGWGWEDLKPYFLRSEGMQNLDEVDDGYHNGQGPLKVSISHDPFYTSFRDRFINASVQAGIPYNPDVNGRIHGGVGPHQYMINKGKRCSSAEAFLRNPPTNLDVVTSAHVMRVLFDTKGLAEPVTAGVLYRLGDQQTLKDAPDREVHVRREVILSAGSIGSPHILLASGIGPAEVLSAAGIPLVHESPGVGEDLMDHVMAPAVFEVDETIPTAFVDTGTEENVAKWLQGEGPLTIPGCPAWAFLGSGTQPHWDRRGQLDLEFLACSWGYLAPLYDAFNFKPEAMPDDKMIATSAVSFVAMLNGPQSRGRLWIESPSTLDPPRIDPRYLSHPNDAVALKVALRRLTEVTQQPAWKGSLLRHIPMAGNPHPWGTEEHFDYLLSHHLWTIYHPACTAKMGPASNPTAVVSPELKVYGVRGLRVVDASIMPRLVGGHPAASIFAIGEKGAALIRGDYKD